MIEVGDKIKHIDGLGGVAIYTVHRVTKARAYIRYNEHAEGCFRREVGPWGPQPVPKEWTWSRSRYEYIPVEKK